MSDETFEYITTDYMISIESNEQTIQPVEYIVELGQEGIPGKQGDKGDPGFSPTVGYNLSDGHLTFTIVNEDGVTVTPDVFDYVMRKDGSNADSAINMNRLSILNNLSYGAKIASKYINDADKMSLEISGYPLRLTGTSFASDAYSNSITIARGGSSITLGNTTKNNIVIDGTSVRYNGAEIATRSDIGNGTVILTQGGVTKGSFSVNQSETTVIDLDNGVSNPLVITSDSGNQFLTLGFIPNSSILTFRETLNLEVSPGTYITVDVPLPIIGSSPSSPVTLTKNETTGISTLGLAYDSTTLGLNADNELTVIGGGTSYTAGTGIDITNDTISIDNTVALKSEIPTNADYVDLTTAQDISGRKRFSNALGVGYNGIDNYGGYQLYIRRNPGSSTLTATDALKATNSNKNIDVGTTYTTTNILGSGTRPTYNSNELALLSDVPTVNNSTITFTQGGTPKGTITLNQSSDATIALDAGGSPDNPLEPLTDKEGLADVTEYAHSTFDRNKFTVVGSPNITDDGIATFSTGNYLKTNKAIPIDKDFVFKFEYLITQSFLDKYSTTQQYIIGGTYNSANDVVPVLFEHTNSSSKICRFILTVNNNGSNQNIVLNSASFDVVLGDKIKVILSRTNGVYKAQYYKNGVQIGTDITSANTNNLVFESDLILGQYKTNWANQAFVGAADLKQFSTTVDGVEVFSGNKTGIDTIKPNDYTVVGSPTISADGVVSNLVLNRSYVETNTFTDLSSGNSWDIIFNFKANSLSSIQYLFSSINTFGLYNLGFFLRPTGSLCWALFTDNGATQVVKRDTVYAFTANKEYTCKLSYTGSEYNFYILQNGVWEKDNSSIVSSAKIGTVTKLYIVGGNNVALNGSIDLNRFQIYVNDNLVYQPCLKIPYTLGNGSKVVDSYYRNRIEDVYNYQGYVRYYTLKEGTNYTLPTQPDKGYLSNLAWVYNNVNSIPDYSAGITMDLGNGNFTAPAKGMIVLAGYTTGQGGSIGGILTVQINSNTIYSNSTSYSGTTYFDLCLPVDSGDVISLVAITTPATINTQKFFPLKEVN